MTQAERTRTIKYVLAESSRWLLRRRDTKKINIPGCREKNKKIKKRKTKNEKLEARHKSKCMAYIPTWVGIQFFSTSTYELHVPCTLVR